MRKLILAAASLLIVATSATAQNNAEEITLSGGGVLPLVNNTKGTSTPFGFWIWCSAQAPAGSNGGYSTHFACAGSMYFYALANATPIYGDASESPEGSGLYTVMVFQGVFQPSKGTASTAYSCSLNNTAPAARGPNNSVAVSCTFSTAMGGSGVGVGTPSTATVTNVVVNATGPK